MVLLVVILVIAAIALWCFAIYAIFSVIGGIFRGVSSVVKDSAKKSSYATSTKNVPTTRVTQSSTQSSNSGLFTALRNRRPLQGATPDSPLWMENLQRIAPYQTLTKAIFYYSVGYFTGAKTLLDTCSNNDYRNTEINNGIIRLRNQATSRSERPGAGEINALQAGNPSQVPYSSVLWAIENGHTDQDVIKGIIELIKLQGY